MIDIQEGPMVGSAHGEQDISYSSLPNIQANYQFSEMRIVRKNARWQFMNDEYICEILSFPVRRAKIRKLIF